MTHSTSLRRLACMLLAVFLLTVPVSAFVIGTAEELQALTASPENSDPVPSHNSSPIAKNLEFSTYKNVAIMEELSAYDPDGDFLTYRITKNPARGSVEFAEDSSPQFTYTPYENKTGKDSFTYVAEDDFGNVSAPATVKIKIQKSKTKVTYADLGGHPAHKAAIRLAELDVLVGQRIGGSYFFYPDETVSREEFLTLAMDTLGSDALTDAAATGFSDDDSIAVWAKPYVASALKSGMVTGSADEEGRVVFEPGSMMTHGEATVLINRLLKLSDVSVDVSAMEDSAPAWAYQSAANLAAVGALQRDISLAKPLTKGETVMMLSAALDVLDFRENSGRFRLF